MAISSYPTPTDAGVLCLILANTVISISIAKEIVRSILHIIGIHFESTEEPSEPPAICRRLPPSESYMEHFQTQTPTMRYDSIFTSDCPKHECSICLTELQANAKIICLPCSHVFHNLCLERWIKYWNTTCPLCRNYMMPQEVEEDTTCPM